MVIGQKMMKIGLKQVFLPSHMITFLRPKSSQPPQFATFKVPLTFNKLDLRDYLYHAYNVATAGIRSQLRPQRVRRSKFHGRIYRPPPIKTMTAEIEQPFVWPTRPADTDPWTTPHLKKRQQLERKQQALTAKLRKTGAMKLRDETGIEAGDAAMRKEASRLLREGGWENKRTLDPKFKKDDAKE